MEMKSCRLGDIAFITKLAGFEHTKYIQGNCVREKVDDTFIPLFIGKTIRDGKIDTNFDWYISKKIADKLPRSFLKRKCLVLPYVGSLGDLAIFDASYEALLGSNVAKIELNQDCEFTEEFIYYFLKSPYGQSVLLKDEQGGIQKNITMESIRNVILPDISVSNQKKITDVLSALDDKIALNQRINRNLEELARLIYDYWFVQFDFPDKNGKPYKTSGGKMVYNDQLKREIPEGWEVKQICDIASFEKESVRPSDNPNIEYKHFSIPGYDECGSYVLETGESILSDKFKVSETDILVSKLNPWTSRVIWGESREHQICSTEFVVMKLHELKEKGFLYSLVKQPSFIDYCTRGSSGTSHSHRRVNPEYMMDYIFAYDKDAVQCFSAIVSQYALMMMKNLRENRRLTALRDKLLPLLMNGQVVVG